MTVNVGSFLHGWAQRDPHRIAMVDVGRNDASFNYDALDRQAARVAGHLAGLGLRPSDRVAICTDNGLQFVSAWFGAIYAGCTTLPIPAMSTEHEIAFRLEHAQCKALLCDTSHLEIAHASQRRAGTDTAIVQVADAAESPHPELAPVRRESGDFAMILYTSGTTGAAKGVCVTHGSLNAHTRALVNETLALTDQDRVLGTLPLTHSYGIRMTLLVPFFAGASTIFVPRFSPERTLDLCDRHEITWLPGVPTMFVAWGDCGRSTRPTSLRWAMSSGAPLVEEARLRAEQQLATTVRQGYGLTEATFTAINAPPDKVVPGSVGKPVAGVEVRIVDEGGEDVDLGDRGEVVIRGQNVMAGYLDDNTATAHATRGGWLHSGDIGLLDDEGRLTVVDRNKDLILRGGHSVYPFEVENVLTKHPAVLDAAVVGVHDDYYGEEIVAVLVSRSDITLAALDTWAREHLAAYKVPRRYAFIPSMPIGGSGKVLKRRLREQLRSGELGASNVTNHRTAQ